MAIFTNFPPSATGAVTSATQTRVCPKNRRNWPTWRPVAKIYFGAARSRYPTARARHVSGAGTEESRRFRCLDSGRSTMTGPDVKAEIARACAGSGVATPEAAYPRGPIDPAGLYPRGEVPRAVTAVRASATAAGVGPNRSNWPTRWPMGCRCDPSAPPPAAQVPAPARPHSPVAAAPIPPCRGGPHESGARAPVGSPSRS
jgi:hypothetical protein